MDSTYFMWVEVILHTDLKKRRSRAYNCPCIYIVEIDDESISTCEHNRYAH